MSCRCDLQVFPPPLVIPPGLVRIERQIAGFPQWRQALLAGAGNARHAATLGAWKASGPNDLGLMLIEMWAYLADVLAFYDEVHAHECYLRTARLPESVRMLVERLGYRARPAVAASVELALLADGRTTLSIPVGTAFRSTAFGSEKPQVFETDAPATIHPQASRWSVAAPRPVAVDDPGGPGAGATVLRLEAARSVRWAAGDRMLAQPRPEDSGTWRMRTVQAAETRTLDSGDKVLELTLDAALTLGAGTPLGGVWLLRPTKQAGLWIQTDINVVDKTGPATALTLDGLYRDLRPGVPVIVSCTAPDREGQRWFLVNDIEETTVAVDMATDADGATISGNLPATRVTLDADIDASDRGSPHNWNDAQAAHLLLHYGLADAGRLAAPPQAVLSPTAPLALAPATTTPADGHAPVRYALQDVDDQAVGFGGSVDYTALQVTANAYDTPRPAMRLPAQILANLVMATRGETVAAEVLGSGDATLERQSFSLRNSPLTHVASATATDGVASTLQIRVDGELWSERPTFYGVGPEERVYVVELDADGVATVSFGGGARLPTGVGNVVASYRHGAGAAAPPPGCIAQIARGVAGLRSVRQPFTAYGGADAEGPETLRTGAPRQALTLGRAVSIRDFEAFAAACSGVRAVAVEWAWDALGLRPGVQAWVVGEGAIADTVRARLQAVSDPTTPIAVSTATAVPIALAIEVEVEAGRLPAEVEVGVASVLLDVPTGLLSVERIGIGRPLYFSRLAEAVHGVPGVVSMRSTWTRAGIVATDYGDQPGSGAYFDFDAGITINGQVHGDAG